MNKPLSSSVGSAAVITAVFNEVFATSENTLLQGGAEEPLYLPAESGKPARLFFRSDYPSSALHEVAHWCIAGEHRRTLVDYGYWYEPDGRSAQQQMEFLSVEARPQALECLFSEAAGVSFTLSQDNLSGGSEGEFERRFAGEVKLAIEQYLAEGMPGRASLFFDALARRFSPHTEPAALKLRALSTAALNT